MDTYLLRRETVGLDATPRSSALQEGQIGTRFPVIGLPQLPQNHFVDMRPPKYTKTSMRMVPMMEPKRPATAPINGSSNAAIWTRHPLLKMTLFFIIFAK